MYLRQSRDQDGNRLAVTRQREDCERLVEARGWTLAGTYEDNDKSATSGKVRPAYRKLLLDISTGAIDAVVTWDLDRLHRRPVELEEFIDLADRHRLALATVGGDADLGTDNGRLFARIKGAVARAEVERKSARQKRAAQQAAENGRAPSRRAFGFLPGGMEQDPAEAPAVREAYQLLISGATLVNITDKLNAAGHVSTRGNPWRRTMVRAMLLNSRNAAIRTYRGEEIGPGEWQAIVPEETWRAAVSLLADPSRRTNKGTARRWLGGGLYLCGRCGSDVKIAYRENSTRVYACRASKHLSRVADPVDNLVTTIMLRTLSEPDLDALLAADTPDTAPLREETSTLRARIDALAGDYADGNLTARQLKVATDRITARLTLAERALADAGRESRLAFLATADDPAQAWLDAGIEVQRAVIDTLMTVTLNPAPAGRAPFNPTTVEITWRKT